MSTSAAAKLLGVSRRTLMRWVNQLGMELEKNELGHYQFSDQNIEQLKQLQLEVNQQTAEKPVQEGQAVRTGHLVNQTVFDPGQLVEITQKMEDLERKLRGKADDVVSYQLLQHRREMEDLTSRIKTLENRIEELEGSQPKREPFKDPTLVFDQAAAAKKPKRKGLISSIFSF